MTSRLDVADRHSRLASVLGRDESPDFYRFLFDASPFADTPPMPEHACKERYLLRRFRFALNSCFLCFRRLFIFHITNYFSKTLI